MGFAVNFTLNAPELRSLKAVREEQVYNVFYPYCCGSPHDKNLLNVFHGQDPPSGQICGSRWGEGRWRDHDRLPGC